MKRRFHIAFERSGRAILLAVSIILLALYAVAFNPSSARVSPTAIASIQQPKLTIVEQADSPLRISVIKKDWTVSPPEVELTIENTGAQSIRAYALRYEIFSGDIKVAGGMELLNKMFTDSILRPGHTEPASIGATNIQFNGTEDNIKVSIDFVEFVDGNVWGVDTYNSKDRLMGLRDGARAATRYFLMLLKKSGPQAVIEAIEKDNVDLAPTAKHSPEWVDSFRRGIGAIKRRLKDSYNKSGAVEIGAELRRPFDASERRQ